MPNYEFKDIKQDVNSNENYNPNKVKTSENTNRKIREKAEKVTKIVENIISAAVSKDNPKEKLQAGLSNLLCEVLSVSSESDVNRIGDPNLILLTKTMKENLYKSIDLLGNVFDNASSLKKTMEENKIEPEDAVADENKEDVNENSDLSNDISEEADVKGEEFVNENVEETQEQEMPKMPIVENEENVESKEMEEIPSFEQSFDWSNQEATDSNEEPTIINDDVTFDFPDIASVDNTSDISLSTDDVYTPTDKEEDNTSINNEPTTTYNYSGMGSSQLYNGCRRLSFIVNSYDQQAKKFDEDLNNEQAEIERLRKEIAVHEENIRTIEAEKNNAYEVFVQAQKELGPIAALFGMNNASYENDSNKHRGM